MIRRGARITQWNRIQFGSNVAVLRLKIGGEDFTIVNVYTRGTRGPRVQEWTKIQEALNSNQDNILLLGDFNTHHPRWGGLGVVCEEPANHLLVEAELRGLYLITARGEATWRRGASKTTIDLTFATYGIRQRVLQCIPKEEWALTQDHIPIEIRLDGHIQVRQQAERNRYAATKLDTEGVKRAIRTEAWEQASDPLLALQQALIRLLPQYCPRTRRYQGSMPDWSPRASELLAGARRARRRLTASNREEDRVAMRALTNSLQKELRANARAKWRKTLGQASSDYNGGNASLWQLIRWSKRKASKAHKDPNIPALRRQEGAPLEDQNETKAEILAEKFFPRETRQVTAEIQLSHQLNAPTILEEEIQDIIKKLPTGKAPGPDEIPNEVLRDLREEITPGVTQAIRRLTAGGPLPQSLRESTTVVLRKEGKKDYTLPGGYRPIALENTIAKVVEKFLAQRLSLAAEQHEMIPWTQMGARKERSTLSAIGLISAYIQTAWSARPGCVVSLLCLDLAGAFDNTPQVRIVEILRNKGVEPWLVHGIECFLHKKRTRLAFDNYTSEWVNTPKGIPQGVEKCDSSSVSY
jgi:hypothetical protein